MTTTSQAGGEQRDVLEFWFGQLDADGRADAEHSKRWWRKDPAFDQLVRDRFAALHAEVAAGRREAWLETAEGRLAYVIVLDQFSRNMFRGQAQTFATDGRALAAARAGVERGDDRRVAHDQRLFLYMPFMHCEGLAEQERCVALFAAWRDELEGAARDGVAGLIKFAEQHRAIVERFGRFPHRNAVLGRESTPEEIEFLAGPGSSF